MASLIGFTCVPPPCPPLTLRVVCFSRSFCPPLSLSTNPCGCWLGWHQIDPRHSALYRAFGGWISACYGTPLARTPATEGTFTPASTLTVNLGSETALFDRVTVREDIAQGQRVRAFTGRAGVWVRLRVRGSWYQIDLLPPIAWARVLKRAGRAHIAVSACLTCLQRRSPVGVGWASSRGVKLHRRPVAAVWRRDVGRQQAYHARGHDHCALCQMHHHRGRRLARHIAGRLQALPKLLRPRGRSRGGSAFPQCVGSVCVCVCSDMHFLYWWRPHRAQKHL